jgi:hypothetical protein
VGGLLSIADRDLLFQGQLTSLQLERLRRLAIDAHGFA